MLTKMVPEILAFLVGLFLAWWLEWQVRDLVWSLWLGSLLVGYATILCGIASGLWRGPRPVEEAEGLSANGKWAGMGLGKSLFLLAFFSFHFCAFHSGHAAFLTSFYPVEGLSGIDFIDAFVNPFKLMWIAFTVLVPLYGWWLLPLFISELRGLAGFFGQSNETEKDDEPMGKVMVKPYANVVKMHLLIFVFAGLKAAGIDGFPVYAVVSFFYFFPWRFLKKSR